MWNQMKTTSFQRLSLKSIANKNNTIIFWGSNLTPRCPNGYLKKRKRKGIYLEFSWNCIKICDPYIFQLEQWECEKWSMLLNMSYGPHS